MSGKTLACWCSPDPCHGDVLAQLFSERLLGRTITPVPDLPTNAQPVAPAIPAAPTTNMPVGLAGLPPLPPIRSPVTSPSANILPPVPVPTAPKLVIAAPTPTGPPPIPSELIQPAPNQQAPTPVVAIQPAATTGFLPPLPPINAPVAKAKPVQTKLVVTKPVATPVANQPPQPTINLEEMLVKTADESEDMFIMRSAYSRVAIKAFNNQINPATAILIGRMGANKAIYGVTYPDESDRVLRYIESQMQ